MLIRDKFTSLIFFWQRSITAHCREPVSPITVFSSFFRDCYVLSPSMGLSESPEFHTSTRTSPFSYQGSIKINKGKHLFRLNFSQKCRRINLFVCSISYEMFPGSLVIAVTGLLFFLIPVSRNRLSALL